MITINKDHHRCGRHQAPLPSTMIAIAAVKDEQQLLASGGCCCQLCGSGDGGHQWRQ
jgi:hypothetical protein